MKLCQQGHKISIQSGLGADTSFSDAAYAEAGATVVVDKDAVAAAADRLGLFVYGLETAGA